MTEYASACEHISELIKKNAVLEYENERLEQALILLTRNECTCNECLRLHTDYIKGHPEETKLLDRIAVLNRAIVRIAAAWKTTPETVVTNWGIVHH